MKEEDDDIFTCLYIVLYFDSISIKFIKSILRFQNLLCFLFDDKSKMILIIFCAGVCYLVRSRVVQSEHCNLSIYNCCLKICNLPRNWLTYEFATKFGLFLNNLRLLTHPLKKNCEETANWFETSFILYNPYQGLTSGKSGDRASQFISQRKELDVHCTSISKQTGDDKRNIWNAIRKKQHVNKFHCLNHILCYFVFVTQIVYSTKMLKWTRFQGGFLY